MRLANLALILGLSVGFWGCAKDGTTASTPPSAPGSTTDSAASGAGQSGAATSTSRDTASSSTAQSTAGQSADRSASADRTDASAARVDPSSGASSASTETSITGCLSKGETAGSYVLTEEKSENKTMVSGSADLEKHVSHKVTLHGTKGDGAHPMFKVTRIQHVAPTCSTTAQ
jgi:hypothetical protein